MSIHHPSAFSWHPDWKVLAGKMGRENIFNILRQLADPPSSNLFPGAICFRQGNKASETFQYIWVALNSLEWFYYHGLWIATLKEECLTWGTWLVSALYKKLIDPMCTDATTNAGQMVATIRTPQNQTSHLYLSTETAEQTFDLRHPNHTKQSTWTSTPMGKTFTTACSFGGTLFSGWNTGNLEVQVTSSIQLKLRFSML